jgi:hypothetical protein
VRVGRAFSLTSASAPLDSAGATMQSREDRARGQHAARSILELSI